MQLETDSVPSLRPAGPAWGIVAALALVPFFISIRSVESAGDDVTYRDYVALGCGIAALALALCFVLAKPRRAGPAGLALGFGLLHVLRGFGLWMLF